MTRTKGSGDWCCTAFGAEWMPSHTNKLFKFIIKNLDGNRDTAVGIVNNKHSLDTEVDPDGDYSYLYYLHGPIYIKADRVRVLNIGCSVGETIQMIIDFTLSTITINKMDSMTNKCIASDIIVNDLPKGPNIAYKLTVSIHGKRNSIQILEE